MNTISCRTRKEARNVSFGHYKNYSVQHDGKSVKLVESPVVAPSLAKEFTPVVNAALRQVDKPLRGRMNVDGVDLAEEINKIR